LKIDKIRENHPEFPGLQDYEANFLRLIEAITDGTKIEINETGTILRFKPGILIGGRHSHDCGLARSIGWFIEGILPLAPFCKDPLHLLLSGITHDEIDLSVDVLRAVTFPLLQNFGIYNVNFHIKKRGVPPKAGGLVELSIPIIRGSLQSVYLVDEGLVKRVRGVAFCTRISPTIITRVIDSCRGVLNDYLPDVHISTDHFKGGKDGGDSPGYSISLIAETTTGALLSVERTAKPRRERRIPGIVEEESTQANAVERESPEDIGHEAAQLLLEEIFSGGVIDRSHQPLILQLMVLTPEDVSKVRFGSLSPQAIETLRIMRDAFGVIFRVQEDKQFLPTTLASSKRNGDSGVDENDSMDVDEVEESNDEESNDDVDEEDDDSEDDEGDVESVNSRNSSIDESGSENNIDNQQEANNKQIQARETYLLSCLGTGYTNVNRRVT
jgi:RNA 3'-terminal phosphate cyclase-like protein